MSRRTFRTALAGATALTLALAPTAAIANDDAPTEPMEVRGSSNSVAQSVQIRTNADGDPNSAAVDFRWSVTQIGAQGDPGADITVAVPEEGLLLHNLQKFGAIPQEDGKGQFDISLNDTGFGTARSVSLVPPEDFELPVELTTEFTLDGVPILAQDLVGKDGVVTAKYTVINKSRETLTVPITSVTGEEIEKEVEADVPMVVEAATLLPDRFSALNTGTGLGGADGRGNTQVKWIALPFSPLSKDGTASFGWAANVTDAVIPSVLVQVLPIYIPPGEEGSKEGLTEEQKKAAKDSVPPPDVSGDVAAIKDGVAEVISGLETLTSGGGEDPLTAIEGDLNAFFQTFGTNIQNVAALLDPENPESVTAQLVNLEAVLANTNTQLTQISEVLTEENLDNIEKLADNWPAVSKSIAALDKALPGLIAILESGLLPVDCSVSDPANPPAEGKVSVGQINKSILVEGGGDYKGHVAAKKDLPATAAVNEAYTYGGGLTSGGAIWKDAEGDIPAGWSESGLPSQKQACETTVAAAGAVIRNSDKVEDLLAQLQAAQPIIEKLAAIPALTPENAAEVQQALQFLSNNLKGIVTTLIPLTAELEKVIGSLLVSITALQAQVEIIGNGLAATDVDLPTVDAVVAEVTSQIFNSPGGKEVTSGLEQISGGVSGAKSEISSYLAELVVALQAASAAVAEGVESGKEVAGTVIETADTLKAEVGGLVMASHTCPLPYGCDVTEAPEGTKLAGAYEFRMDPADKEAPSTLPRVLLGLVLLLVAGFLGSRIVTQRREAAAAAAAAGGSGPDGPDAGELIDSGYPSGSDDGGSAAGLATAAAAGATAVALADDDRGDATTALPVETPEELTEAVDSVEGEVGEVGEVGDMADQAEGEVGDMADSAEGALGDAADSTEAAGDAVDGTAEEATGMDLPDSGDGGENKPW